MTKIFTQTSNLPYDRHQYKFIYSDGTHKIFEHYEDVQMEWFQAPLESLGIVEVLDRKSKNQVKGFG